MFTRICTLVFDDGSTVSASVSVESPQATGQVSYTGQIDRLPAARLHPRCVPSFLETLFSNLGRDLGARFSTTSSGDFAQWAE